MICQVRDYIYGSFLDFEEFVYKKQERIGGNVIGSLKKWNFDSFFNLKSGFKVRKILGKN